MGIKGVSGKMKIMLWYSGRKGKDSVWEDRGDKWDQQKRAGSPITTQGQAKITMTYHLETGLVVWEVVVSQSIIVGTSSISHEAWRHFLPAHSSDDDWQMYQSHSSSKKPAADFRWSLKCSLQNRDRLQQLVFVFKLGRIRKTGCRFLDKAYMLTFLLWGESVVGVGIWGMEDFKSPSLQEKEEMSERKMKEIIDLIRGRGEGRKVRTRQRTNEWTTIKSPITKVDNKEVPAWSSAWG